jgi:hypothetical protein
LRRQLIECVDGTSLGMLARRAKLDSRALGERLDSEPGEHLVGDSELLTSIHSACPASEPLAVEQSRGGQVDSESCAR